MGWKKEKGHKNDTGSDISVLLADSVMGYIDIIWYSD